MKPKVNWPAIIKELKALGCSHKVIGAESEVSEQVLSAYKVLGRQPGYQNGEAIIDFWMLRTGKAYSELPRLPR